MEKNFLKKVRESMLISKVELAEKANISRETIARIERGMSCRIETKGKLLKALGIKFDDRDKIFPY